MRIKKNGAVIFLGCFLAISFTIKSQDSLMIPYLINRITRQQVQQDAYFLPGIFSSYITKNEKFGIGKKDNNIFFNCLVVYVLKDCKPFVDRQNNLLINSIFNSSRQLFARFKNKKRDTYNFWRTDSAFDFPFTTVFNFYSKAVTLPDDMDCTALSLLALDAPDSTAEKVHGQLQRFVNSKSNKVRSAIAFYDTLPAYSTWLGIKFPVVFDVSVLCNVLGFVQRYNLPWTKADSASLQVIVKTIQHNDHITRPIFASPVYPTTSLILYHIARLMRIKKIPALEALKTKLVTDAATELSHTDNLLEKIILSSAILKWGYTPPPILLPAIDKITESIEQNDFSFFIANLPSYFKYFLKIAATKKRLGFYNYYCPAFNDALLLEYLVLRSASRQGL